MVRERVARVAVRVRVRLVVQVVRLRGRLVMRLVLVLALVGVGVRARGVICFVRALVGVGVRALGVVRLVLAPAVAVARARRLALTLAAGTSACVAHLARAPPALLAPRSRPTGAHAPAGRVVVAVVVAAACRARYSRPPRQVFCVKVELFDACRTRAPFRLRRRGLCESRSYICKETSKKLAPGVPASSRS